VDRKRQNNGAHGPTHAHVAHAATPPLSLPAEPLRAIFICGMIRAVRRQMS
jgi:hypothetical protein